MLAVALAQLVLGEEHAGMLGASHANGCTDAEIVAATRLEVYCVNELDRTTTLGTYRAPFLW